MTKCNAVGALIVGGRVVGQVRCDLEAGHDEPVYFPTLGEGLTHPVEYEPPTPHSMTMTWAPEEEPDLDLFDPDESFDLTIELTVPSPDDTEICEAELGNPTMLSCRCVLPKHHAGRHACVHTRPGSLST